MKIKLKPDVVINVKFELAVGIGWIQARWEDENLGEFVVTSLKDGQHMLGSQHHQDKPDDVPGEAVDIRTRHHFDAQAQTHHPNIINFAKMLQREDFKVVVHPDWSPGVAHLHVGLGQPIIERVD